MQVTKSVNKDTLICLWKLGTQSPTSPFFRNGKDPLEDFDYNDLASTHSYDPQSQELLATPLHTSTQAALDVLYYLIILFWTSSGVRLLYQLSCPLLDQLGRPLTILAWISSTVPARASPYCSSFGHPLLDQLAAELLNFSSYSSLLSLYQLDSIAGLRNRVFLFSDLVQFTAAQLIRL
ncbi:hypothetical protein F511_38640 [Dorcoceras hygrometricum]|uniref:Uncharacterized protein n=1 Tax=Dorcoceras hygrometricum TaxID=472368 RepID=A0A2Z7A9L1_9LAMI|nr:hypothetical protein F511_38640 [Dorcoceras hygrometricum]